MIDLFIAHAFIRSLKNNKHLTKNEMIGVLHCGLIPRLDDKGEYMTPSMFHNEMGKVFYVDTFRLFHDDIEYRQHWEGLEEIYPGLNIMWGKYYKYLRSKPNDIAVKPIKRIEVKSKKDIIPFKPTSTSSLVPLPPITITSDCACCTFILCFCSLLICVHI